MMIESFFEGLLSNLTMYFFVFKRNMSGVQEARGLDAGPRLFDRLVGNGDNRSASIAKCIAEEEIAHVAVGVAWFLEVCRRLGKDSALSFQGISVN